MIAFVLAGIAEDMLGETNTAVSSVMMVLISGIAAILIIGVVHHACINGNGCYKMCNCSFRWSWATGYSTGLTTLCKHDYGTSEVTSCPISM